MIERIKISYYNLKHGISNLIKWFPVIWDDRNWDYYFIFKMLEHKFKLMEEEFRARSNFVGDEKVLETIKQCREFSRKLQNEDNYTDRYYEHLDKLYGELQMETTKLPDGNYKVHLFRDIETEESMKVYKAFLKLMYKEQQDDLDEFMELMKNNIQKMWF